MLDISRIGLRQGDRVLLAPYNPITKRFRHKLSRVPGIQFVGFLDKDKTGELIHQTEQVLDLHYDRILILSPNWGLEIYSDLLRLGVHRSQTKLLKRSPSVHAVSPLRLKIDRLKPRLAPKLQFLLQRYGKRFFVDKRTVLLLSPKFVDLNIKDTYLALERRGNCRPIIAGSKNSQLEALEKAGFDVVGIGTTTFYIASLKAKVIVMDHNPIGKLVRNTLIGCKLVQIWHGIPLKKIGHLIDYKRATYDIVVSTSAFVSEYAFSKLFDSKKLITSGYPRNDILAGGPFDERQLALIDEELHQWILGNGKKILIYMPTWRGYSFEKNPINLEQLNDFCRENDLFLVIKMHPFIRPNTFFDTLETDQYKFRSDYKESIVFYSSTADIYPLLRHADLLITDYSSVCYDFLMVNKPIVYFVYDLDEYRTDHGEFMLDFDEFTPGPKAATFGELLSAITNQLIEDTYGQQRSKTLDLLFDPENRGRSGDVLADQIVSLSEST